MSPDALDGPSPGGESLTQLIYRSVSTTGVASALQMSDILAEARSRNARLGVTGVLTAVDGVFVQIIEGPDAGIEELLAKLSTDPRHHDLRILERRPRADRAFGDWDMVSPRLAAREAAQIARLLARDETRIDAFIPVLKQAVTRQEAVLEGVESPVSIRASASPGFVAPNRKTGGTGA